MAGYDEGCDAAGVYPVGGTMAAGFDAKWKRLAALDARRRYPDARVVAAKDDMWNFDAAEVVKADALKLYSTIIKTGVMPGKRARDFMAAAMLSASRVHGAAVLVEDVAAHFGTRPKAVIKAATQAGWKVGKLDMRNLALKLGWKLGFPTVGDVARKVVEIDERFPAMTPRMKCALAAQAVGVKDAAQAFGVSQSGLERYLKYIR